MKFEDMNGAGARYFVIYGYVGPTTGGFVCLAGPLTSALCNRFGSRPIAMYGSLIAAVVLLISTLAHSAVTFLVLFGVFAGLSSTCIFHHVWSLLCHVNNQKSSSV